MLVGVAHVSREVIASVRIPLNTSAQPFISWEQFLQNSVCMRATKNVIYKIKNEQVDV